MESASVVFSKCANAPSGTALAVVELVVVAGFVPAPDVEGFRESAFTGGASVLADGVYNAVPVNAFDPADDDPDDANDDDAPAPVAPADALD